jgi:hypothetical protein
MMSEFFPLNDLEHVLVEARNGKRTVRDLIDTLIKSELAVPSASEVMANGSGFEPLLFSKEGMTMLSVFSDKSRIVEFAKMTPYCLIMSGADLLRRIPAGYGLVVNPGSDVGFDIPPAGISQIKTDLL